MDLRKRSSIERWRREMRGPEPRVVGIRGLDALRRACPPDIALLGSCGLIAWLALVAWTGGLSSAVLS